MFEVRGKGILQLSCSSRESGQPSKFSVTGDPALDACASAPQPEESDDLAATRGYRGPLAPQPSILHPYPNLRFDASVDDLSANDSEEFACLLGAQHRHHIQLCKPPCPHPNTHRSNSHKNKNQNGRRCQIHKTRPVYQLLQEPPRKLGRYDP